MGTHTMVGKVILDKVIHHAPLIVIERDPCNLWNILKISEETQNDCNLSGYLLNHEDLLTIIDPQDKDIVSRKLGGGVLAKKPTIELKYRISNGKYYRWVEDYCSILYSASGEVTEVVSFLWMSSLPLEWAMLLNGSEVWNTLNSKVRHDILNQLTAILGYLELSTDIITDPMLIDFAKKEQNAAEKIREKMIFTREYQKIGRSEFSWYLLEEIIKESLNHINLNNLSLSIDVGNISIYVDKNFRHALEKIIENIPIHAMGATNIKIKMVIENCKNFLVIEDNGCGIPIADKPRLFELGFGKGSGYGLFLVEKILFVFGITIEEVGVPGKNALFKLHIPSWIIQ
jgi:hypothetical protein